MTDPYTVLLTAAGGDLSVQMIRQFRESSRHRITMVAVDARDEVPARLVADHFTTVPRGDAPGYVDALLAVVERHEVDLVLPCSDEEALALSPAADRLAALGAKLACAGAETLRLLADKDAAFRFLRDHGLPTPDWRRVDRPEALEPAVLEIADRDGELAVKPARSRGSRDVCVIRSDLTGVHPHHGTRELHMDLESFLTDHMAKLVGLLPILVMERLREPCYDVDILAFQGEALRVVPRRRLNPVGVPFMGNVIVPCPEIIELGRKAARLFNLSWLYDLDMMSTRDGQPVIIEVNPRPSGSVTASVAAGVPLLDDLVSLAKGEDLPPLPPLRERLVLPYTGLLVS